MSFISPQPCDNGDTGCCPSVFIGFCLLDGTPISIVVQGGLQLGWTNLLTGVFTAGPPPAGTGLCSTPLNCETDSVTICADTPIPVSGIGGFDRFLDYTTDSISNWPDMENVATLSTTTPLGIGGVFTSPWIPVDRRANIRIGCRTDQNGELHTQHSNDNGVTIIRDSNQPITAFKSDFLSFHPRGNYFRVVFLNTSGVAQTELEISTEINSGIYGLTQSIFSAPLGRESFGVQTRAVLYDYNYDESAIITPFIRDLVTVSRKSLFADAFEGTAIDTDLWASTLTGSGTTTQVANVGVDLATGLVANSTVRFESTVRGRFIAGNLQSCRSGIFMPDAGVVNNRRRWGAYDDSNGFYWELDGTTLYAVGRIGGVDSRVASTSWNKINTFILGAGEVHSYEVSYFADTAWFVLDGQVHHIMGGGSGRRGTYPNRFENINSGGLATNQELYVLGTFNQRYGPDLQQPRYENLVGATTSTLKNQAGHLYRVIVNAGTGTNTATIYDNTIGAAPVIATLDVNKNQGSIEFGIDFSTGLTLVVTGATTDLTVVFD